MGTTVPVPVKSQSPNRCLYCTNGGENRGCSGRFWLGGDPTVPPPSPAWTAQATPHEHCFAPAPSIFVIPNNYFKNPTALLSNLIQDHTPCLIFKQSQKFFKNFEKLRAKKSPGLWPGLKGSLNPRRSNEPTEVASKPEVSIYSAHRDSNPQLRP
jgi:hypothetical protein